MDAPGTQEPSAGERERAEQNRAVQEWLELIEQSQRVTRAFLERQPDDGFSIVNPQSVGRAFLEIGARLLSDPARLAEAQLRFWQDSMRLLENLQRRLLGEEVEPVVAPERGDRRFRDDAWSEDALFDYVKQSYLLAAGWIQWLVHEVEDIDPGAKKKAEFFTRQMVSAMAPSNFALTNPGVLRKAAETGGENLLEGLRHMLDDLERGRGRLQISMTDMDAFRVGENVAVSPGKVIYQNELMQLIQYAPSTETVHSRPMLIVPPWINKFYVLDLQPKNSFIKWTVDRGYTVFVISWVNPREELSHKNFVDYMLEGPLAALEAIEQATGEREATLLGFCIGGILALATLAYMAAKDDTRVKAVTLLATMVDLRDVGEASVFIDEEQLEALERHMGEKGYLEGRHMADMFNMMRENDLIWSFVVNNYLMGKDPMPFDLLFWNSDSTRLPATMLAFYLRKIYMENALMTAGGVVLDGVPIDLGQVRVPVYSLATKEDHISPWLSCYPVTQVLSGPVRFVLGASGHIAGVINPPERDKYCYWTNQRRPADAERWLTRAEQHPGSWWPDWERWLARHSGSLVPAREPGGGALPPIEDAPGSYVKVRASE